MSIRKTVEEIREKFLRRMDDNDWEEDLHPRGEDGKFVKGSGGAKDYSKMSKDDLYEELKKAKSERANASNSKDYDEAQDRMIKIIDMIDAMSQKEWAKEDEPKKKKSTSKKTTKEPKTSGKEEHKTSEEPKEKPKEEKKAEEKTAGNEETKQGKEEKELSEVIEKESPAEEQVPKEEPKAEEQPKGQMKKHGAKNFPESAYTAERKDNVANKGTPEEVDKKVRGVCSKVWNDSTEEEQKAAIMYTRFSGLFNKDLRERAMAGDFETVDREEEALTKMISKSTYDFDMMLQRGNTMSGASKLLGVSQDLLEKASSKKLNDVLRGVEPIEYAFTSTGAAKGYGTTPQDLKSYKVQYNIYAPAGTQMLYCEPFSWWNNENKDAQETQDWWDFNWWDGKSEQKDGFSREFEMLIQRNTRYRVTGAKRDKGVLWIDMEVIGQGNEQD